jgi:hypothetical protein
LYPIIHKAKKAHCMPESANRMQAFDYIDVSAITMAGADKSIDSERVEMPHFVT